MNKLYVMSGCPGSGKTYYAKTHFPDAIYVSRDEIRFSMVSETEEYFSKEKQVFKEFISEINAGIASGKDVVADATHLNEKSRTKLFNNLIIDRDKTKVEVICMQVPLHTCIKQNENRKGTRSYVPQDVIKRMFLSVTIPSYAEREKFMNVVRFIRKGE